MRLHFALRNIQQNILTFTVLLCSYQYFNVPTLSKKIRSGAVLVPGGVTATVISGCSRCRNNLTSLFNTNICFIMIPVYIKRKRGCQNKTTLLQSCVARLKNCPGFKNLAKRCDESALGILTEWFTHQRIIPNIAWQVQCRNDRRYHRIPAVLSLATRPHVEVQSINSSTGATDWAGLGSLCSRLPRSSCGGTSWDQLTLSIVMFVNNVLDMVFEHFGARLLHC